VNVTFKRTGERRYGVWVERPGEPELMMHPAPLYDASIPHDLAHFVVERECGIAHGVYGQIAAGGTAGTFHRADGVVDRALKKRSDRLLKAHEQDMIRSEQLAQHATRAWQRGERPAGEVEGACRRFDSLAERWRALEVGESLTLQW
jgi:hypothetical protein